MGLGSLWKTNVDKHSLWLYLLMQVLWAWELHLRWTDAKWKSVPLFKLLCKLWTFSPSDRPDYYQRKVSVMVRGCNAHGFTSGKALLIMKDTCEMVMWSIETEVRGHKMLRSLQFACRCMPSTINRNLKSSDSPTPNIRQEWERISSFQNLQITDGELTIVM